ncbi:MAG: multidrug DMT transporter permease [Rhodovarius sp.]|nr:multidrug DMT transporter permease [Rhodovarius sp.]MCX7932489.1 multidrug DMT transporter permease [Rhodovarius sp.]MDW8315007.1 multidrug DMT transporter permease [Rhodovarius sp.]
MGLYFLAMVVLSVAAVIEARCSTPGLRPADPAADRAFRLLGRSAFAVWLGLIVWGFFVHPWWQPVAAVIGSLAANAMVVQMGGHPWWPGISMGLALLGLMLASFALVRLV